MCHQVPHRKVISKNLVGGVLVLVLSQGHKYGGSRIPIVIIIIYSNPHSWTTNNKYHCRKHISTNGRHNDLFITLLDQFSHCWKLIRGLGVVYCSLDFEMGISFWWYSAKEHHQTQTTNKIYGGGLPNWYRISTTPIGNLWYINQPYAMFSNLKQASILLDFRMDSPDLCIWRLMVMNVANPLLIRLKNWRVFVTKKFYPHILSVFIMINTNIRCGLVSY